MDRTWTSVFDVHLFSIQTRPIRAHAVACVAKNWPKPAGRAGVVGAKGGVDVWGFFPGWWFHGLVQSHQLKVKLNI